MENKKKEKKRIEKGHKYLADNICGLVYNNKNRSIFSNISAITI